MALTLAYSAVVFAALSGLISVLGLPRRWVRAGTFALLGASGAAAVIAGAWTLVSDAVVTDRLALGLPWLHWHLRLDPLSGFFGVVVGIVLLATSFYGPAYTREFERGPQPVAVLHVATGLFAAGMLLVLLADDAFSFMVAWELMSVSSYLLVTFQHQHAANRSAGFLYLLMAHIGALAILLGFGVLAAGSGGFTFDAVRAATLSPTWASIAFALALFGFGMKAGMVPLHAWLPEAHPVAPSHISALMSGVMLKVAIYGLIRFTFDLLGSLQWQWGVALLLFGAASALLGVLYALMQHDLKRLLAYHSVENIGIILMGLGLAVIFASAGSHTVAVLGLLAALYHTLNHAVFKGLLFLGAGAVLHRTRERDLEHMGGLIRRMPVTAFLFLIGCISISALPPFNGFVSEWLTFQAALQVGGLSGVLRAVIPLTAAMLALAAALAAACFVKAYGVAFLGKARTRHVARAREVRIGMRAGMGMLAALCLILGVFPTTVIDALAAIPRMLLDQGPPSATAHGWLWLTPVSPDVASYSAPLVFAGVAIAVLIAWLVARHAPAPRRTPAWDCGFGPLTARMQYTSTAFAMPIRRVFRPVWNVDEQVDVSRGPAEFITSVKHQLHIGDRSWPALYAPIGHLVLAAARRIGWIQTGAIRVYLLYSFLTLLLLLWIVT